MKVKHLPVKDDRYYLLIGNSENWKTSLEKNMWGFSDKTIGNWNTTNIGEIVGFYVTSPFKKIIGFGKIINKFVGSDIIWQDEKFFEKPLWKYRLSFEIISMSDTWEVGVDPPQGIMLNSGRKVLEKKIFRKLVKTAEKQWNVKIDKKIFS
jgi:hypothetical protein